MYFLILYEGRGQRREGWESGRHFSELHSCVYPACSDSKFAAIAVPKHLLCTLEQTDDSCEDPKVSHRQGEHHFCLGQGPYSRGDKDNQRGPSYAQIPRSLRTLQPHRGSAAGCAEVFLLQRLSLVWAPGKQAGRSDSGNRGKDWSSAGSCSAHQAPSPLPQDLAWG